jgi:rhodanese-related sulfurtransferase
MNTIISKMDGKFLSSIRVSNDEIIELLNNKNEIILLDIRYPFETKLWGFNFTKNIPLNELPNRLDELDKDKLIITICPESTRSNMACLYLLSEGFDAKFSDDGLIKLTNRLRGGKAKDLKI